MKVTLKKATHPTRGALASYHVVVDGTVRGSMDELPSGEFFSYVAGDAAVHGTEDEALTRICAQQS